MVGVASGGDAVNLGDTTGNYVLNQLSQLDSDYRNSLGSYYDDLFRVNMYNAGLKNEIMAKDQAYERQLASEERALNRANDQMMLESGIDPSDPQAKQKFINHRNNLFKLQEQDTKSIIQARNQRGGSGIDPTFAQMVMKGREAQINQIESEIKELTSGDGAFMNEELIKAKQDQLKYLRGLKIDPESTMAQQLYQEGVAISNHSKQSSSPKNQSSSAIVDPKVIGARINKEAYDRANNPEKINYASLDKNSAIKAIQQNPNDQKAKDRLADIMVEIGLVKDKKTALAEINKRFKGSK
ncbi:MAG: hypothetical protein VYB44_07180 [Bacteroidota bacterium]|nr:hypothetical protein [Bacteroidota bacterium]